MQKRHVVFISVLGGLLIAGIAGYGACAMEIDDGSHDLLGSDPPIMVDAGMNMPIPPPELEDPEFDPEGIGQGMPPGGDLGGLPGAPRNPYPGPADNSMDRPPELAGQVGAPDQVRTACGAGTCAPSEVCCVHEGACYPRTCRDCCAGADDAPGPAEGALDPPVIDPAAR